MNTKLARELNHNRKILETAEDIWGRSGKAGQLRLERRADLILKTISLGVGKKVLEIGCGTGTLTKYLVKSGAEIIATDIFPEFLKIALENSYSSENCSQENFLVADAERLENFSDNQFDLVCGLSILHHLDIKSALNSAWRVLKPGGFIAFSEPNMLNPQIALQKNILWLKKLMGDSPDETAFFKWQMKRYLNKVGFSNIMVEPFDFLHPVLPDFLAGALNRAGGLLEKIPFIKEFAGSLFIVAKKINVGFRKSHISHISHKSHINKI